MYGRKSLLMLGKKSFWEKLYAKLHISLCAAKKVSV
jgi:hypothetical protein